MKTILFIIQKEFKQIFRNKGMLPIIFVLPLIQLLILSNAASFEVKNIPFSFVDNDHSKVSREFIEKFKASDYFKIIDEFPSKNKAVAEMQKGNVDVILEIPVNFEKDLIKYISMKQRLSSSKVNEEKKEDEKAKMLWDVNPAMIENYWSTTQRD